MPMMSRRRAILSLSMVALMLALPWTVSADSSGRDGSVPAEEIRITTSKDADGYNVDLDVQFDNLTDYQEYDYNIYFTRVDPNFSHETLSGNFTANGETHNISRQWTPDQEGPYTVQVTLLRYGHVLQTATDSFDWGDVANNSGPPEATISVVHGGAQDNEVGLEKVDDWYYLNIFENESLQENTTIEFDASETETGASYRMTFALYQLGDDENVKLLGMGVSVLHAGYTLATLNNTVYGWIEGGDYQFTLELELNQENMSPVAYGALNFTVGRAPPPAITGCTDGNASNYDENATADDGTCVFDDTDGDGIFDYLEIEGCTDLNAENYDGNATDDDGSCEFTDTDGDGVFDHLEIEGCTDFNAVNYKENATDDDGSCEYKDSDEDGVFDYLEVVGCTDKDATNWNSLATDEDVCVYPELNLELYANQSTGIEPLEVSFVAGITGGNSPYEILWNFGDGDSSTEEMVNHIFAAGVYTVVLQVTDDNGDIVQRSQPIVASEIPQTDEFSGYFTHSGQLEPMSKDMFATFQFTGIASGGEGPYTFTWHFGDDTMGEESTVIHEYARTGEYAVQLTIEDSAGRIIQITNTVNVTKFGDGNSGGVSPTEEGDEGGDLNFELYATGAGVIGLLLIFGLFGRKRREGFLEKERRKMQGEGSIWDDY